MNLKGYLSLAALLCLLGISPASARAQQPQDDVAAPAPAAAEPQPPNAELPATDLPASDSTPPAQPPVALAPAPPPPAAPYKPKNDRIFLVIPNYGTVEHPGDFMPIGAREKFKLGALDAFDPYSFPIAGIVAGISQADNDDSSWGQGLKGYGLRYAASYADTVTGSFMTSGVFPALLREDPRYFRKGEGNGWKRSGYAIKRLFVIRTDSGGTTFNFSEFGGNAAASAVSLAYHSSADRTVSNFLSDWLTQTIIDFTSNQLKEFWPDIRHRLIRR